MTGRARKVNGDYFNTSNGSISAEYAMPLPGNLLSQIEQIRDTFPNMSKEAAAIVLQSCDFSLEQALFSITQDGAEDILSSWNFQGKKGKNGLNSGKSKRKRNRRNRNNRAEETTTYVNGVSMYSTPNEKSENRVSGDKEPVDDPKVVEAFPLRLESVSSSRRSSVSENPPTPLLPQSPGALNFHDREKLSRASETQKSRKHIIDAMPRSKKDLHRSATAIARFHLVHEEKCDKAEKDIKNHFSRMRESLTEREKFLLEDLETIKVEAAKLLNERQEEAATLKHQCDRIGRLRDQEVVELRSEIKRFIGDRKIDEEVANTNRFIGDPEELVEAIKKFGHIKPLKANYTPRSSTSDPAKLPGNDEQQGHSRGNEMINTKAECALQISETKSERHLTDLELKERAEAHTKLKEAVQQQASKYGGDGASVGKLEDQHQNGQPACEERKTDLIRETQNQNWLDRNRYRFDQNQRESRKGPGDARRNYVEKRVSEPNRSDNWRSYGGRKSQYRDNSTGNDRGLFQDDKAIVAARKEGDGGKLGKDNRHKNTWQKEGRIGEQRTNSDHPLKNKGSNEVRMEEKKKSYSEEGFKTSTQRNEGRLKEQKRTDSEHASKPRGHLQNITGERRRANFENAAKNKGQDGPLAGEQKENKPEVASKMAKEENESHVGEGSRTEYERTLTKEGQTDDRIGGQRKKNLEDASKCVKEHNESQIGEQKPDRVGRNDKEGSQRHNNEQAQRQRMSADSESNVITGKRPNQPHANEMRPKGQKDQRRNRHRQNSNSKERNDQAIKHENRENFKDEKVETQTKGEQNSHLIECEQGENQHIARDQKLKEPQNENHHKEEISKTTTNTASEDKTKSRYSAHRFEDGSVKKNASNYSGNNRIRNKEGFRLNNRTGGRNRYWNEYRQKSRDNDDLGEISRPHLTADRNSNSRDKITERKRENNIEKSKSEGQSDLENSKMTPIAKDNKMSSKADKLEFNGQVQTELIATIKNIPEKFNEKIDSKGRISEVLTQQHYEAVNGKDNDFIDGKSQKRGKTTDVKNDSPEASKAGPHERLPQRNRGNRRYNNRNVNKRHNNARDEPPRNNSIINQTDGRNSDAKKNHMTSSNTDQKSHKIADTYNTGVELKKSAGENLHEHPSQTKADKQSDSENHDGESKPKASLKTSCNGFIMSEKDSVKEVHKSREDDAKGSKIACANLKENECKIRSADENGNF